MAGNVVGLGRFNEGAFLLGVRREELTGTFEAAEAPVQIDGSTPLTRQASDIGDTVLRNYDEGLQA